MPSVEQQLAEALAEIARLKQQCSAYRDESNASEAAVDLHWSIDLLLTLAVLFLLSFAANRVRAWHSGLCHHDVESEC